MQLSLFPTTIPTPSTTTTDPHTIEWAKGCAHKLRGAPRALWDRFVHDSHFDWSTGHSQIWHFPPDILVAYGGNGGQGIRRGTIFRTCFALRTHYTNNVVRVDDGLGGTHFEHNGAPTTRGPNGRATAIQVQGYASVCPKKMGVPSGMAEKMVAHGIPKKCAVSATSDVEIDHKQGRADHKGWLHGSDPDLYQFLSKPNNGVKRNACKRCVDTNQRFDATSLNFKRGYIKGDATFTPELGCTGCYWFDVRAFHAAL